MNGQAVVATAYIRTNKALITQIIWLPSDKNGDGFASPITIMWNNSEYLSQPQIIASSDVITNVTQRAGSRAVVITASSPTSCQKAALIVVPVGKVVRVVETRSITKCSAWSSQ